MQFLMVMKIYLLLFLQWSNPLFLTKSEAVLVNFFVVHFSVSLMAL
jgi:hypothetical protein